MIQDYASSLWEKSYNAVAPGSRIPEWFADQSMGCSVKVKLPSHWYNTKLLGMAVCVVVGVKVSLTPPHTLAYAFILMMMKVMGFGFLPKCGIRLINLQ